MSVVDAVDAVTHEARGALGTIRLVLTTLLDTPPDAEARERLLRAADTEAVRLVADLASLPSLVAALSADTTPTVVDFGAVLHAAARELRATGTTLDVFADSALRVTGNAERLEPAMVALLRYGAARCAAHVRAVQHDDHVRVTFAGADWRGPLVQQIADVLGVAVETEAFTLPLAGVSA